MSVARDFRIKLDALQRPEEEEKSGEVEEEEEDEEDSRLGDITNTGRSQVMSGLTPVICIVTTF